jgi:DNA replication protein DnaC
VWSSSVMGPHGIGRHEDRPLSALFISAPRLARISDYSEDRWDELRRVDRLVIDDFGRETLDSKGRALGNIVDLLCERHDGARRTVFTANMTTAQFRTRYCGTDGGRLWDRLRQGGRFCEMGGESMRATPKAPARSRRSA